MELSKKDKRAARELIAKGMHEEFRLGMLGFDAIMQQWRGTESITGHQEYYAELYGSIMDFNKHIARRYDYLRNHLFIDILATQLNEKLIDPSDLDVFSPEVKEYILLILQRRQSFEEEDNARQRRQNI